MFRLEWTAHERKAQAEIDELYGELLESIEIDGPYEFATLYCAARLLETNYTLARVMGFADRESTLDDADIVDFFESTGEALEALESNQAGVLEFYVASAADWLVFEATDGEELRLYRVPWLEASAIDLKRPLPQSITAYPITNCTRGELISHLWDLRRGFACAAIEGDPRLARHEPLRSWSVDESGEARDS